MNTKFSSVALLCFFDIADKPEEIQMMYAVCAVKRKLSIEGNSCEF